MYAIRSYYVKKTADAFVALGIREEENVAIFSQNKPECFYVDFGAFANRAVTVPLYATSSSSQAQYIVNDAEIRFLFVGEQLQYDVAFSILSLCPVITSYSIHYTKLYEKSKQG